MSLPGRGPSLATAFENDLCVSQSVMDCEGSRCRRSLGSGGRKKEQNETGQNRSIPHLSNNLGGRVTRLT